MVLDGKKISQAILADLKKEVASLPFKPLLVDVVVGSDPVIASYVKIKNKRAEEIGVEFRIVEFPETVTQQELADKIEELNEAENICGLIMQLPLPAHIEKQAVLDCIDPAIDVDVINTINVGKLFAGNNFFSPATASAAMRMLAETKVLLAGAQVLVIGAGDLVGKPVTFLLMQKGATVTVANAQTKNLAQLAKAADIIISGAGSANLVTAEMVQEGAIVIDAGTTESAGGITGDVDFVEVAKKAAFISPVPGGVGPVTVAMLLHNVVRRAKQKSLA